MIQETLLLVFLIGQRFVVSDEKLQQIRSGDPYKILGEIEEYQTESNCNVEVAWLKPPIHSKMAFHGHESACSRIKFPIKLDGNKTASMIDMWSLNELLNNEKFQLKNRPSLKCFFIKNRIGDLAISVRFHPRPPGEDDNNLKIKLEILDLKKESTHMPPQDVLCARFTCKILHIIDAERSELKRPPQFIATSNDDALMINSSHPSNLTMMTYRLGEKELVNRELNRQIIIYRIACALLTGLLIIFAIMTLGMCIKVRNYPKKLKKISKIQQNYVMPYSLETNHQTPSYYHMNGKLGLTPPSPLITNDHHHPHNLDTSSVNNIIMTNSNLSACDGHLGNANPTYVSYPVTTGSLTNNAESMLAAYVPVVNRPSISSARNYIVSCTSGSTNQITLSNNGNCSPSSSILEGKMINNGGSVSSSLTRQHSNNLSRRKVVVLGKNSNGCNNPSETTLSPNFLNQYNNHFTENTFGKILVNSPNMTNMNGHHENVIHCFPNGNNNNDTYHHLNGSRVNSEIDSSPFLSSISYPTSQSNNNNNSNNPGNSNPSLQVSNTTSKSNNNSVQNPKSLLIQ